MTKPTQPWSMARVASRRELPKPRKMHGPVGESFGVEGVPEGVRYDACRGCGYHVCSCKPVESFASRYAAFIDDMPQRTENKFNFPVMSCIENGQSAECKPVEDEVR